VLRIFPVTATRASSPRNAAILTDLLRQFSTAAVVFHHAIAERLGLGPTDHKCFDLLRQRGPLTGSDVAALTGLTTGAITGVVNRLESAGFVSREPDPDDGRRQFLRASDTGIARLREVFEPIHRDAAALLEGFDGHQRQAIADFLQRSADFALRRAAMLRTEATLAAQPGMLVPARVRKRRKS
jgi:DNA-binding MarR family transcriptional regulator